jgi:hypothetical protein
VRRHDPPTLLGPQPSLALSSSPCGALKFGVGGGEIPPIGGDDGLHEIPSQIDSRASGAKSGDFVMAVEILGRPVAQRMRALPE